MGLKVGILYTCDGCGATLFAPSQQYHAKGFKSFKPDQLKRAGWLKHNGNHLCPECKLEYEKELANGRGT